MPPPRGRGIINVIPNWSQKRTAASFRNHGTIFHCACVKKAVSWRRETRSELLVLSTDDAAGAGGQFVPFLISGGGRWCAAGDAASWRLHGGRRQQPAARPTAARLQDANAEAAAPGNSIIVASEPS